MQKRIPSNLITVYEITYPSGLNTIKNVDLG